MPTSQERGDQAQPLISGHRPNTCKDLTLGSTPEGDTKQKATQSRRRRKEATSTTSRRQEQQIMPSSLWPSTSHRRMHTSTFVPSLDDFINVNCFSSSEHNKYLNLASHRRIATGKKNSHGWSKFIGHSMSIKGLPLDRRVREGD